MHEAIIKEEGNSRFFISVHFFYNVMPIVVLRNKGNHFRDVVINRQGEKRIYLISIWDYSTCIMLKMNQSDC